MYTVPKRHITRMRINAGSEGEPLHLKIERMLMSREKIDKDGQDSKPLIYTDKKDGVLPNTDIRTDKWEHAAASSAKLARDYINSSKKAAQEKAKEDGKTESTDGKVAEKPTTEGKA